MGGRCYFCCKVAATNGHRSKLTPEQLGFVGFATDTVATNTGATAWVPAAVHSHIDKQLDLLEAQRDIAPGWFALARRILEDDGGKQ